MELVSIIVPIYNMEKYIGTCIESILKQTYIRIEIILVDDGSTDSTGVICDEYAKRYCRNIRVIHQKNGGISAARNAALKEATGKYIFFIDADDYYVPDFIEKMVQVDEEFDYVVGGYIQKNIFSQEEKHVSSSECELTKEEVKRNYKGENETLPLTFVWGKRYKLKIIKDNGITFDCNCKLGEDIRFNLQYLECAERMKVLNYSGIYHVRHDKCATSKFYPDKLENLEEECRMLERYLEIGDKINQFRWYYWNASLIHYETYWKKGVIGTKEWKSQKKRVYKRKYFRQCLNWVIKNGTLDMKIQGVCILLHIQNMYPFLMKMIVCISNIKCKTLKK